ncbi:MAG: hypothetical protein NUV76_12205 [Candidatus Kuenenia sp.]|nr:hypothetical protein [Candidatus Kuenenia sp.]
MAATTHSFRINKGTTSKRLSIFVQDSFVTTGVGLAGLTSASAGLKWYFHRENEGDVGATAVTLAAGTRGTYLSGGFIEKDAANMPGFYEIGLPDAVLATGAKWVMMELFGAVNMSPVIIEIELVNSIAFAIVADAGNGQSQFKTNLASAVDDAFKGGWVQFDTDVLADLPPRKIASYNGTTKWIILTSGFPTTPINGAIGRIINE